MSTQFSMRLDLQLDGKRLLQKNNNNNKNEEEENLLNWIISLFFAGTLCSEFLFGCVSSLWSRQCLMERPAGAWQTSACPAGD